MSAALLISGCGSSDQKNGAESSTGSVSNTASQTSSTKGSGSGPTSSSGTPSDEGTTSGKPESDSAIVPTKLPIVTGTCPEFVAGDLEFQPAGVNKTRKVKIWISEQAKTLDGPVVFYWHGTNGSPKFAPRGLGPIIKGVTDLGGVVIAPYHDPDAGTFPWFLVGDPTGARLDDLLLADEVLACAIQKVGVDLSRIHVCGMSAGGLQTAQMSYRRSNYIASASPFSGGFVEREAPIQDPNNPPVSMIFHGGETDVVVLKFQETSERYLSNLQKAGGFGFICNHNKGHKGPEEDLASVWQFFQDHPYKVDPVPYLNKLPDSFPSYCVLP